MAEKELTLSANDLLASLDRIVRQENEIIALLEKTLEITSDSIKTVGAINSNLEKTITTHHS